MDGSQLSDLLHQLRPETTLFIISSKSFGTIDTLSNAETARLWLEKALGDRHCVLKSHFIGVSTKPEKMTEWGIHPDNQLLLWDWVGGRYSYGHALVYRLRLKWVLKDFRNCWQVPI
jgi:glucose-6-phosphate isomerase